MPCLWCWDWEKLTGEAVSCKQCGWLYVGPQVSNVFDSYGIQIVRRFKEIQFDSTEEAHQWLEKLIDFQIEITKRIGILNEHEIEQILGQALDCPRYCDDQKNFPNATERDGVCVGEHVAVTIAAEAANKIKSLKNELDTRLAQMKLMQQMLDKLP